MQDASSPRYLAEQCFRVVRDHPNSPNAAQFKLWGQEFLERAQRVEALSRSDARCKPASFQLRSDALFFIQINAVEQSLDRLTLERVAREADERGNKPWASEQKNGD
jgi:hypothetical protein